MNPDDWDLKEFGPRFEHWCCGQDPSQSLIERVLLWTFTLAKDPYRDSEPSRDIPGLFQAVVPGSLHGNREAVLCTFWIDAIRRTVTCDNYASLGDPII